LPGLQGAEGRDHIGRQAEYLDQPLHLLMAGSLRRGCGLVKSHEALKALAPYDLQESERRSLKDGPRFKKRLDPERSEFTADAGMFESAERRLLIV